MKRLIKTFSFVFLSALVFLRIFVSPVSAQTAPNCGDLKVKEVPTDANSVLQIVAGTESIKDDRAYVIKFENDAITLRSTNFTRNDLPYTATFSLSIAEIKDHPGTVSLFIPPDEGVSFCHIAISFDPDSGKVIVGTPGGESDPFVLCAQAGTPGSPEQAQCQQCFDKGEIWTGVGCIPFSTQTKTVRAFIVIGMGITGAAVLLLSLYAGFLLSISQGNPTQVDEAKAAVTSAIAGAFFIIFSVTILRFIGVNILQLPFFG